MPVKFEMICNRGLPLNGCSVILKMWNVPELRGYVPAFGRETSTKIGGEVTSFIIIRTRNRLNNIGFMQGFNLG
eukprot:5809870-Ditylum_brightwellii.AAC.1